MSRRRSRRSQQPVRFPSAPTRGALALADQGGGTTSTTRQYPAMPKVPESKPLLTELGATGTAILAGIITSDEYNADFYWKDAIKIYEQMTRNDAQIFAIRQMLELPIRRAKAAIEPASDDPRDVEIASFVESCLFHDMRYTTASGRVLTQKWDDLLRHILMMMTFGFSAFEVVWRIEDGWVKWARWMPLLPRTVWRWWVDDDNELAGIQQWTYKDYSYQFIDIPADKLLLFVHRQEGNNYEGVSVLRSAYKHWFYKDNFYKIDAIAIERNAITTPVFYLPENFTPADVQAAQTAGANLRAGSQMSVTLPPGWNFEYPKNWQRYAQQIQPSIDHHDIMIARNVLAQFINLGSTETGAYALADSQTKTFLQVLQAECEYIEDVVNTDAIRRLVDYNYANVAVYPKLKFGKVALSDVQDLATGLSQLATAGLVHSDPQMEDFLRDAYGLPSAPLSPVENTNPTAPSDPARPPEHPAAHTTQNPTSVRPQGATQPDAAGGVDALAEIRLLREALGAVMGIDAVERGTRSAERAAAR